MQKGFVYILECSDGSYYTGSTIDIEKRIAQHQNGQGANHTRKRLPVNLIYLEEFQRIDDAFYREKQIQGWSRNKKTALIEENFQKLSEYAECMNDSHYKEWLRLRSASKSRTKSEIETHYSNGKLLITGEYVVLDGALSLAIPTKFGQSLEVTPCDEHKVTWKSFDSENKIWFETVFEINPNDISLQIPNNSEKQTRLLNILQAVKKLNPEFLTSGCHVETKLTFPQDWGLGTSSTLINNIASWAKVDAYKLLELTFGGSGYDIACAQNNHPISYQIGNNNQNLITEVDFNPSFKEALYFVYLNKKQNSRDGIAQYKASTADKTQVIKEISKITLKLISSSNLKDFNTLLNSHEQLISSILQQVSVKEKLFPDFKGSIKSLGAWGGDFVLVTSEENPTPYFRNKGYHTIVPYSEMIK
ncbi:GYDIA family GHMP kinase [Bizionia arctica]|uniref:GIY-YIG domain-containing protein n=1 Tax=Bizionia arctica TaxID=1495645 RepID=A0A917GDW2_9FLAO|nr:GYDIA family GHMP kinase [Bizionia arctica]GGG40750.1 hypothetical protein GCM10010976_10440 [Bizionia arctica]